MSMRRSTKLTSEFGLILFDFSWNYFRSLSFLSHHSLSSSAVPCQWYRFGCRSLLSLRYFVGGIWRVWGLFEIARSFLLSSFCILSFASTHCSGSMLCGVCIMKKMLSKIIFLIYLKWTTKSKNSSLYPGYNLVNPGYAFNSNFGAWKRERKRENPYLSPATFLSPLTHTIMRAFPIAVLLLSVSTYFFLQRPYLSSSALSFVTSSSEFPNQAVVTLEEGKISLISSALPEIPYGKVLVRVHYAPINPSDVYRALGSYQIEGIDSSSYPHPNGFEGSGVVVGSGGGFLASLYAYIGTHVGFIVPTSGSWSRFVICDPMEMFPLYFAGVSDLGGAAAFVNPMTVVGMLEVARYVHLSHFLQLLFPALTFLLSF